MDLFLLRHAKSSWDDESLADHDRPLAPRGRQAAARIAEYVRAEGLRPALALCSSARRAVETLDAVLPAFDESVDVRVERRLYGAGGDELLERLREVPAAITPVLVVGHNPGLQDLAIGLAGEGDDGAVAQLHAKFPTGALATFRAGVPGWGDLTWGSASLTRLVLPRSL